MRSLILFSIVLFSCPPLVAQDLGVHDAIKKHLNAETVLVGWLDISSVDSKGLFETVDQLTGRPIPEADQQRMVAIHDALKQLDVSRVYWISDLASIPTGEAKMVIPCENAPAVALLLGAALPNGAPFELQQIPGAVVGGTAKALERAKTATESNPSEALVDAIAACEHSHGVAFATPPYVTMSLMGILKSAFEDNVSEMAEMAKALAGIQWLAVTAQLPPGEIRVQVQSKSAEESQALLQLVNRLIEQRVKEPGKLPELNVVNHALVAKVSGVEELQAALQATRVISSQQRAQTANSLKQVALALHNYASAYKHFPPQSLVDADGKRLLSWRVLILPFLEQSALYDQFHLDEPWDSPHNLELAKTIPFPYQLHGGDAQQAPNGAMKTRVVAPMTAESVFGRPGGPMRFREILDGTSNTIWLVETTNENAVIWTKPEDLPIDKNRPLESIAGEDSEGFWTSFVDGSVRYLAAETNREVINALLTIAGGEVIDYDELK